jgi:hypothetical protein
MRHLDSNKSLMVLKKTETLSVRTGIQPTYLFINTVRVAGRAQGFYLYLYFKITKTILYEAFHLVAGWYVDGCG